MSVETIPTLFTTLLFKCCSIVTLIGFGILKVADRQGRKLFTFRKYCSCRDAETVAFLNCQ